jgi:hypothetical protein
MAQWHLDYFIKPLRDQGFNALLAKQRELTEKVRKVQESGPPIFGEDMLALMGVTSIQNVAYMAVYTQSVFNEAIAACALERYRIEHGTYPERLEEAKRAGEPAIPLDIISGKPMGYRRTADGRYALWCVGFDGVDDGGIRGGDPKKPESQRFSRPDYKGDWVWDFSGK